MLLFLALLLVPLIEIALFIEIGGWIGLWPTILTVIATAVLGTVLLRSQGVAALRELQEKLAAGQDPGKTLAHGALILVAGVVLLTPGFFTDFVGLMLLVPPVRARLIEVLAKRAVTMHARGSFHARTTRGPATSGPAHPRGPDGVTVEGEYEDVTPGDAANSTGAPNAPEARPARNPERPSGWTSPPGSGG